MSSPDVIRAEGLTRAFGSVRAVDGLDLEIPAGTVFGFLGPNGAGKTTTIRLLLGLLEPTSGRATVLGCDTRADAGRIREQSGALLEHHGLYERLSAEQNLEFYARVWRLGKAVRAGRIRALLHEPSLLFLDEPTAGLDPVAAATLRDDLGTLVQREGVTVFLTTHNLVEAERLCSRVAVIKQGRLVAIGHPDELKARRATRAEISGRGFGEPMLTLLRGRPGVVRADLQNGRIVLELAESAETAPLVALIVQNGGLVEEVRKDKGSLEDVFLTLMEEEP